MAEQTHSAPSKNLSRNPSRNWIVPMLPRSADEKHRASTPLELFFDLVFVVAIAQAGSALHHGLAEGQILYSIAHYFTGFFAIWWAWMNFTWFASAYDCDDVPYRIATFVQITGALIIAAGVQRAFETGDHTIGLIGYVVMRLALVSQYIRAGRSNPSRRATAYRYAIGVTLCQIGWIILVFFQGTGWHPYVFVALGIVELLVPAWGEQAGRTSWHPGHIIERYGLFTIIVLGESILALSTGIQTTFEAGELTAQLTTTIIGGLLIIFSMWWAYFDWPADHMLTTFRRVFIWGYGHLFVFASIAALGSGLAVQIESILGHTEISETAAAATVTVPVAIYMLTLWALHFQPQAGVRFQSFLIPIVSLLILLTSFTGGQATLFSGILLVLLLIVKLTIKQRQKIGAAVQA
jgi:low temperature requirement protein LtrA